MHDLGDEVVTVGRGQESDIFLDDVTVSRKHAEIVHGALVAYDATAVTKGRMKQLFHSDANPANDLGNFAKYATPVVANGKVYVATFSKKVVQYGL